MKRGLLKCYYGYQNRGDELLFFGVVKYLFGTYEDLTHLDVEVGDVDWMTRRRKLNHELWMPYQDKVRFVPSRRFSMWIAGYDLIFLGGGEVLAAQTRSFWHGGVNYLALFWRWIWSGRVVWLGGIETPNAWWSKALYRMMLPYAREIVCREQGSYDIAKRYTDKVVLYHDWAIDVLEAEGERLKAKGGIDVLAERGCTTMDSGEERKTLKHAGSQFGRKVLLLHGQKSSQSNNNDGWVQRTGEQLIDEGFDVKIPFVDKTREVGWVDWKDVLDQYIDRIDKDTILIGHSAGGAALVRRLGETPKIINKLILVAPGYIPPSLEDSQKSQIKNGLNFDPNIGIRDLYDFTIDPTIKNLVSDGVVVLTSNDTDRLLQSAEKYIATLGTKHIILEDRGYFNHSYGPQNDTFPELLDIVFGFSDLRDYVLVNFIPKHTTPAIIAQFHEWMQHYPDHQIINFPAEQGDVLPDEIIAQYADRIQTRQRWEHDISQTLSLFRLSVAGFGLRLHFIIPFVYYELDYYRLTYSEKVNKILHYWDNYPSQ